MIPGFTEIAVSEAGSKVMIASTPPDGYPEVSSIIEMEKVVLTEDVRFSGENVRLASAAETGGTILKINIIVAIKARINLE